MALADKHIKMEILIKVNLETVFTLVKVFINGRMDQRIKDHLSMVNEMDMENGNPIKEGRDNLIKDNIKTIERMDMVNIFGQIIQHMKETSLMM